MEELYHYYLRKSRFVVNLEEIWWTWCNGIRGMLGNKISGFDTGWLLIHIYTYSLIHSREENCWLLKKFKSRENGIDHSRRRQLHGWRGWLRGAGMAQWWERSPPTNVSRVRFRDPASYVGWVCCWFSSLLREVFLRVLRFSPLLKGQHFQIPISSGIVKHFIMSLWLGWLRKHSLCLTLNLHFRHWVEARKVCLKLNHSPCFFSCYEPQAAQALSTNHTRNNMVSNCKGLYGIFYKISMEIVTSKIVNKNGLHYSIGVLFAPGVVILPI